MAQPPASAFHPNLAVSAGRRATRLRAFVLCPKVLDVTYGLLVAVVIINEMRFQDDRSEPL